MRRLALLLGCFSLCACSSSTDAVATDDAGSLEETSSIEDTAVASEDTASDTGADTGTSLDAGPETPSDHPADWVKAIVATGYGGIRLLSIDGGKTWKKTAQLSVNGGDDENLLRAATYGSVAGKGRWVAAGWKYFTSEDGRTWTEGKNPKGCNLMESVAFGNDLFVAACGGHSFLSNDGLAYTDGATIHEIGHVRVSFSKGTFYASGDDKQVFTSTDGKTWSPKSGLTGLSICGGVAKSETECGEGLENPYGGWLRTQWKGKIQTSPDQMMWTTTYTDDAEDHPDRFAFGYAPPG
jgi:hypothetical protein